MNVVSFPGLGLEFALNRVAVQIGGLSIYWYGVIIASGFLLAVIACSRMSGRFGITSDQIFDMLCFAVPAAIVGLRIFYVVFNLDIYRRMDGSLDWWAIVSVRDGGLAIYGAIISSIIVLFFFCRKKQISFFAFADLGVYGLFIGQLVGRWGNFVNVEAYGGLTTLPWRMCSESIAGELYYQGLADLDQYYAVLEGALGVHPTFLYESLWNLVGLAIIYYIGRYVRKFDGQIFFLYIFWYGVGRFWIEGLRTDSLYFFGLELFGVPIRTSQMLAGLSAIAAGIVLLLWLRRPNRPEDLFVNQLAARQAVPEEVSVEEAAPEEEETLEEPEKKTEVETKASQEEEQ